MSKARFGRSAASSSSQHRTDIDGLRAVAVLSVLGFHTGTPGLRGGFVGVDVFFVVSGYLICSIIVREIEQQRFSIARFYARRCKRILPALLTVLLFCMFAALFVLSPYEMKSLGRGEIATILSVSNVQFWRVGNYFDHGGILNPLLMTWSLAVEEQFYLVFPLLMLFLYKRSPRHLLGLLGLGCAASLSLCIYMEFRHPPFNFYLPFTRAWEIGAGTLLAVWQAHSKPSRTACPWLTHALSGIGLLAILACVFFYSPSTRFPGYEAIPPVAGTLLLLHFSTGIANRLLGLRPLVAIGLISYSLYLWHWPLLSFATIIDPEQTSPIVRLILMLVATGAATLSYFFIETPFRAPSPRSAPKILASYASAILCMVLLGVAIVETDGASWRAPALAAAEDSLQLDRVHDCIAFADKGAILTPHCFPPPSSTNAVALLGDSHAEAIESTVRKMTNSSARPLIVLTAFSCPPLRGITRSLPDAPQHATNCMHFNTRALDLLSQRHDVSTVLLIGSWAMLPEDQFIPSADVSSPPSLTPEQSEHNLVQGLSAEVHALEAQGKRVIVLDDWPTLDIDPLAGIRYATLPVRRGLARLLLGHRLSYPVAGTLPRNEIISPAGEGVRRDLLALADHDPNLQVIDSKRYICSATACQFQIRDHLLYTDAAHMSEFGAEQILSHVSLSDPN
jgi:peptidoglycan/LPS O-acetylase OafA/YrhL